MFPEFVAPRRLAAVSACVFGWLAAAGLAGADLLSGDVNPGHSWHGEAFNEGPRQQAYLMEGMPRIDFPISTTNELARRFFNQGIGQLHGFWYFEAERTFRRVHQLDANCAMAYWGMAMANVNNAARARAFLTNAVARQAGASPRERLYIEALAAYHADSTNREPAETSRRRRELVRAYEGIVRACPDDPEAKAFLIYQIWDNSGFGNSTDLRIASHLPIDWLARQVLGQNPLHPIHHYRIHLWDPERPSEALDSAARCGQGSPGIAHMWHMPGHTYAKLARHDDAAWQQEASARVDHAHLMRDRVIPDQIHNYAHNNDWLAESWAFLGRVRESLELSRNMIELPRVARTNAARATNPLAYRYDFGDSSWRRGRARLIRTLIDFELWDELQRLAETAYLEPSDQPEEEARRAHAMALAWFAKGDLARATNQLTAIERAFEAVREERRGAVDFAETEARRRNQGSADLTRAMTEALERFSGRIDRLEAAAAEVRARAALAIGDTNALNTELDRARDLPKERLARIHWEAGDRTRALELAREASDQATNQVQQVASYADLLWRSGDTNAALAAFDRLRESRTWPDLDLPVLRRLAPIAAARGLPSDWRVARPPGEDVGDRPPLESLGPRYWQPGLAPEWKLVDGDGKSRILREFRGRPLVLLFYLGRGCPHCLEQLNTFAPAVTRFASADIALAAISTDGVEGLRRTVRRNGAGRFPFPLLADPDLEAFRGYRAYDDFEALPLHGIFLIDAEGYLRWQDIGYEPFMDIDFLLAEARRLLRFASPLRVAAGR